MLLGFGAYSLFPVHDMLVKLMVAGLPVTQILLIRSVIIASVVLAFSRGAVVGELLASRRKGLLLWRAVATLAAWCLYYVNGTQLKLAEMTTLYYVAPLVTLVLAVVFLKEKLTAPRVFATLVGFVGVVVACNPAGIPLGLPALMVLTAASLWSIASILMRTISSSDSSRLLMFSLNAFYVLALLPFAIAGWKPMDAFTIACALGTGLAGGAGQLLLIEAARRLPAGVLGTVEYTGLVWSFIFGALIFHEAPAPVVYAGAGLVVVAGLILAWGERIGSRVVFDPPQL
jgi:drug/metabolite transporter (DMT)-like permease